MYEVKFEDSMGNTETLGFKTAENAENYIEGGLESAKDIMVQFLEDYDYGEIGNDYGNLTTEIWTEDRSYWYKWSRTWKKGE